MLLYNHEKNTMSNSIKELRIERWVSQQKLADLLGVTRQTYSKLENWKIDPTLWQAVKISEFFGVDVARFLPWDTQTTAPKEIDWEKYKQIIKNFIKYGSDDWKITKTKLAKLCYLLDFAWYYYNLESITWLEYRRIQQWPVPDAYFSTIEELQEEESIMIHQCWQAYLIENIEEPRHDKLSEDEMNLLEKIAEKWKNNDTKEIVDFTHQQLPRMICGDKEIIPYDLITQEESDNVY